MMLFHALLATLDTIVDSFFTTDFNIKGAKDLAVGLIGMTDIFLLGMVLYVVAIGMYQLFIDRDIDVRSWMRVDTLEELKFHLVNVIMVLLAVSFLADVVEWDLGRDLLL